jgi:hypothetical protein
VAIELEKARAWRMPEPPSGLDPDRYPDPDSPLEQLQHEISGNDPFRRPFWQRLETPQDQKSLWRRLRWLRLGR